MVTSVRDPDIDRLFPHAASDGYDLKSPPDDYYNCIAWAAGVTSIPWWPTSSPLPGVYWPHGVTRERTLDAFVLAYGTLGYSSCGKNGSFQKGYEKIAIYVGPDGKPTHAARQLADGVWTSKLGRYRDIHHTTTVALEKVPGTPDRVTDYGTVAIYMRRKRKSGVVCLRTPDTPDIPPPDKESRLVKLLRRVFGKRGS